MLTCRALCFSFIRDRQILRDISLDVPAGQVTAIIGPNGSGKTTLLRLLLGVLTPQAGYVFLDGAPLRQSLRRGKNSPIAFVPQSSAVAFPFTVREVVSLGRYTDPTNDAAIDTAMGAVAISDRGGDAFHSLSAGQQQRATLARALAQLANRDRGVLLADEPVSAMDPAHALRTLTLLREQAARGIAIAVVLHDLYLVRQFADRVIALGPRGALVAQGPTRDILIPDILREVFGVRFVWLHERDNPDGQSLPAPVPPE